jgi:hypothetical protein
MRRDPRDTGLSLWRNMFPEGLHRYAYDQTRMARYIRLHEALVSFWAERLPDRVHILDYEALTETRAGDPGIVAFAGLPWDDACLAPQSAQRSVATLSFAQVRQPIGRGSVGGWRRFEAGLGALIEELDRVAPPELLSRTDPVSKRRKAARGPPLRILSRMGLLGCRGFAALTMPAWDGCRATRPA